MASVKETAVFFTHGDSKQYEFVLSLYPQALLLKAKEKNKKPEEMMKLDAWYQEELPKKIRARGKDAHLTHDELVQCMKWKLTRGQWRPRLQDLVRLNTPRSVETESRRAFKQLIQKNENNIDLAIRNLTKLKGVGPATASEALYLLQRTRVFVPTLNNLRETKRGKFYSQMINLVMINTPKAVATETRKALRKLPNLESALNNLSSLKGVGTTMATAVLAAAAPEIAPFMADECLMAIPDIEGIDYTAKEYLKYVQHIRTVVDRLNAENQNSAWSPHRVELALWAHYVTRKFEPSLLDGIPGLEDETKENGNGTDKTSDIANGSPTAVDGKDSEDSSSGPLALAVTEDSSEATNDSLSVVINSEETSREPTTNGNGTETTNDENTNDHDTPIIADGTPTNGGTIVGGGEAADDNAVVDQEELEPSSKKIRLQEPEPEEGTA